jgi:hypothetical protein
VTEIVTAIQQRHLGQFFRDTGGILSATGVKWPTGVRPSVCAWQVSVLGGEPVER